ncbi:MAG TPA: hypothetical protein VJU61_17625 [Polyangiaceae bacterium]|nr:hypothetical protein [Polyangiaceae bacterium]
MAKGLGEREVRLAAGLHYLKFVQQSSRGRAPGSGGNCAEAESGFSVDRPQHLAG